MLGEEQCGAKDCGVEFRAAVEAVRLGGELLFPKYARPGPFLQDTRWSMLSWSMLIEVHAFC